MVYTKLRDIFHSLFDDEPDFSFEEKARHSTFMVNKRVFAYTKDEGLVLKLPKARVQELLAEKKAQTLVMGKKVMDGWIVIEQEAMGVFKNDQSLLVEAFDFVASGN